MFGDVIRVPVDDIGNCSSLALAADPLLRTIRATDALLTSTVSTVLEHSVVVSPHCGAASTIVCVEHRNRSCDEALPQEQHDPVKFSIVCNFRQPRPWL